MIIALLSFINVNHTEPIMQTVETFFLSPERLDVSALKDSAEFIKVKLALDSAIDSVDGFVMVLNRHRQMVWANDALADYLNCNGIEGLGKRPGELLQCTHASDMMAGCGTSMACRFCGAALAIKEIFDGEIHVINECSLIQQGTNRSFEFRVKIHPLVFEGETYLFCVFFDISSERRRTELEQAFVHDIANLAGSVDSLSTLIGSEVMSENSDLVSLLKMTSSSLISAVEEHRFLILAEQGDLSLVTKRCYPGRIVDELISLYGETITESGIEICCNSLLDEDFRVVTVPSLLRRIIENLLKNAIEASSRGGGVAIELCDKGEELHISVENEAELSVESRARMFTRAYTTKGVGRGIGLYSVKLFTENYLEGTCDMRYDEEMRKVCFIVNLPIKREGDIAVEDSGGD